MDLVEYKHFLNISARDRRRQLIAAPVHDHGCGASSQYML